MIIKTYQFKSNLWLWAEGKGAWYFVSLPLDSYKEIKDIYGWTNRGFGSIPVLATIGETTRKTSIFPSKHNETYILPIKSSIRKSEKLELEVLIKCIVEIK